MDKRYNMLPDIIRGIDWQDENNRSIAEALMDDAEEYLRRVEAHIFKGNEVRNDRFMDRAEKQEELSRLDRKRTAAHNKMLGSFGPFLDLLRECPDFDEDGYDLSDRTHVADFVFSIVFGMLGMELPDGEAGCIRDELAEKLHKGEISIDRIRASLCQH